MPQPPLKGDYQAVAVGTLRFVEEASSASDQMAGK